LSLTGCLALSTPCDADVTGTGTFAQGFSFPTALQNTGLPNVIFNFESGITGVAWGVQYFDASILAPDAVASNNGASPLVGNLIAASVLQRQSLRAGFGTGTGAGPVGAAGHGTWVLGLDHAALPPPTQSNQVEAVCSLGRGGGRLSVPKTASLHGSNFRILN
jgi:hypothetical protein